MPPDVLISAARQEHWPAYATYADVGIRCINEQTFRTRMTDLANGAQEALSNIVSGFVDWPRAVHEARNILAHQGTQRHDETIDQFYDLVIALSYSVAWVLRTVLLLEAGFDAATLQRAYRDSSRYNHHLANVRSLLAGSPYAAQ
jgi:lipopolysaccharide biosynthesis regulator YciM